MSSELENSGIRVAVGDCSVTEHRRWRPPYQTGKTVHVRAKHYKHNEDGRTAPGMCGNGSVLVSHSGNVVTRIGIHTTLDNWTDARRPVPQLWIRSAEVRGWGWGVGGNVVRRMGTQETTVLDNWTDARCPVPRLWIRSAEVRRGGGGGGGDCR